MREESLARPTGASSDVALPQTRTPTPDGFRKKAMAELKGLKNSAQHDSNNALLQETASSWPAPSFSRSEGKMVGRGVAAVGALVMTTAVVVLRRLRARRRS